MILLSFILENSIPPQCEICTLLFLILLFKNTMLMDKNYASTGFTILYLISSHYLDI